MPQASTRPRSVVVPRTVKRMIALHENLASVRKLRELRALDPDEFDRLEAEFNEGLAQSQVKHAGAMAEIESNYRDMIITNGEIPPGTKLADIFPDGVFVDGDRIENGAMHLGLDWARPGAESQDIYPNITEAEPCSTETVENS